MVQMSGKQVYMRSEPLLTDLLEHLWMKRPFGRLNLVGPGEKVDHHIETAWNVSGFQFNVKAMAPCHDLQQERTHLR